MSPGTMGEKQPPDALACFIIRFLRRPLFGGEADGLDKMDRAGYVTPLNGLPISIKDLLDGMGEVTRVAARALDDAPPAPEDAPVVTRLKQAGTVLLGRTNMTPFAYSVVGLN